ncbi:MAG: methylmalonyl Co-A mutase-associated GTPase MeaB [Chitinophagaceae bacterium]|nr:MAG: methylmalonyl Co-A mutase-associated GTPase MeaB [Chitinophagaceae bacterium]
MWSEFLHDIQSGDSKALARGISLVENEVAGYGELMRLLPQSGTPVIGLTGPPGAGKSTLADALIAQFIAEGKKVGLVCVDPSSPFNRGAVLGDRIRMSSWYNHPGVFIRSLASRGAMGGLNPRIIEITDLMKAFPFDILMVETVGVGQSEIEIAGLADLTVVVLVPEGGDEIQTMKAGLMEIADVFVVNKADRPDADLFARNLRQMLAPAFSNHEEEVVILKTVASEQKGVEELSALISTRSTRDKKKDKKSILLAERAWQLIQHARMRDINKPALTEQIGREYAKGSFNLYRFVENYPG